MKSYDVALWAHIIDSHKHQFLLSSLSNLRTKYKLKRSYLELSRYADADMHRSSQSSMPVIMMSWSTLWRMLWISTSVMPYTSCCFVDFIGFYILSQNRFCHFYWNHFKPFAMLQQVIFSSLNQNLIIAHYQNLSICASIWMTRFSSKSCIYGKQCSNDFKLTYYEVWA